MSATATSAVVRAETRLFLREPGSLFWILLFPTGLLGILGFIPSFREASPDIGGARVVDLYASVSVLLAVVMAAVMAMPSVIVGYRETGVLRRLRATPVGPGPVLLAQVVTHAVAVLLSVVLVLATARLALDVPLPREVAWYVVCLLLAVASAFAIGAVITAVSPRTRLVQTISTVVLFPLMFTAGVWLPVQTMSGWLHTIVVATPLGAAAEALTDTLMGRNPDLVDLLVMAGWTAVLAAVAVRLFRWE